MPDSGSKERLSIKLKGLLDHTASWARILHDGRVELEYYDFSPAAQDAFGNDVAWLYRIEASQKPQLFELLAKQTGTAINEDETMLEALARTFSDANDIRDWLKQNSIPYQEEFDSWA
jgi:hypothetical protein